MACEIANKYEMLRTLFLVSDSLVDELDDVLPGVEDNFVLVRHGPWSRTSFPYIRKQLMKDAFPGAAFLVLHFFGIVLFELYRKGTLLYKHEEDDVLKPLFTEEQIEHTLQRLNVMQERIFSEYLQIFGLDEKKFKAHHGLIKHIVNGNAMRAKGLYECKVLYVRTQKYLDAITVSWFWLRNGVPNLYALKDDESADAQRVEASMNALIDSVVTEKNVVMKREYDGVLQMYAEKNRKHRKLYPGYYKMSVRAVALCYAASKARVLHLDSVF